MASNYFNAMRTSIHCTGSAYSLSNTNRQLRDAGMRDDRDARRDAIAARADYDATCK